MYILTEEQLELLDQSFVENVNISRVITICSIAGKRTRALLAISFHSLVTVFLCDLELENFREFHGDGTFRAVAEALLGFDVRQGLVATGTNNNIARALGLPPDPHEATEVVLTGSSKWISAGQTNGYFFLEGAGIGPEPTPSGDRLGSRTFQSA
jgi:hypothetical protein